MAQPESKLVTPLSLTVDLVLVAVFFTYMLRVASHHVPSHNPHMVLLWGALCSLCLSGVFWLALQMFRVVYRAHEASAKASH